MNTTTATTVRRRTPNSIPKAIAVEEIPADQLAQAGEDLDLNLIVPIPVDVTERISVKLINYRGEFSTYGHHFTLGSVAEFAALSGWAVDEAVERAVNHGHSLYYAVAEGVMITAHKQEVVLRTELELGSIIEMDGQKFQILQSPNYNLELVPLATA